MTFTCNHSIGDTVSVPNPVTSIGGEVTGTIESVSFSSDPTKGVLSGTVTPSPTYVEYVISIPEQTIPATTAPAQTIESGLDG